MDGVDSIAKAATEAVSTALVPDDKSNHIVQVVSEDQKFTQELPEYMQKWDLHDNGFDYNVVAVFGSQSTGKSTLLNRLFGTTFDVMSENQRQQTTKGIWMCKGQNMNVLVMDVEGTDGRERGEDQDFERKSALFSMATAEVLIVNLWEHQVGLYQGANMGLLKTVMEVNLGLFQASRSKDKNRSTDKALLLFVIRDHIGATPLENLKNTLTTDINRIWDGLSKPQGLEDAKLSDYFDLDFNALPHKLLQPKEFDDGVANLRKRFSTSSNPDYVFKPNYHKRIPADGVAPYMEGIWEQILENKDLDLPTQQELLAQFRCDEIGSVAFKLFEDVIVPLRRPIETGSVVDTLGPSMIEATTASLTHFDRDASRYHSGVYQRKREDLIAKMFTALSPLFLTQLKNLHKVIVRDFKSSVLDQLKGEKYDFATVVNEARSKAENDFSTKASALVLENSSWSIDEPFIELKEDLDSIAETCRQEETKKMITLIEKNMKKQFSEPVEAALNKPTTDMWDKVLISYKESLANAEASYTRKAKSFNCTDDETASALESLRKAGWRSLRAKVDEQTADNVLILKLKTAFEDRFRYDSEGVPRVWKPEDDIDAAFRDAKEQTLSLIPLYSIIKPSEVENEFTPPSFDEDDESESEQNVTMSVLSNKKQDDLANRFRREADAYYVEAKRSLVLTSSQIPYWMYGVLVVLGWNEFLAVVRSPLYFTFVLILAVTAYTMFRLNLMGPAMSVAKGIYREVVREANDRLQTHFSQQSNQNQENIELRERPQ